MFNTQKMKTMKKYSMILGATLSIFALASCQKEIDNPKDSLLPGEKVGSVPFVLNASIAETKTTLDPSTWEVNWEDGDIIYAVTTDEEWGVAYANDNEAATVAEFTYDSTSGKFSTTSTINDGNHTFNFLYTNGAQKSYHRGASTTFSLAKTQDFDANAPMVSLKNNDALAAQLTATTPTALANISMSHLFTLMKVTLKNKTGNDITATKFEITADTGTYLYGIYDVTFGSTPSVAFNKNGGNSICVNISNGAIANDGTLDVYFVMAPISNYTGNITLKVTDNEDKVYTKTNTVSGVTFAAGKYNTASFTMKSAETMPTISTSNTNYTTGFETGFNPSTIYNNTSIKEDGPDGGKWGSYYGTVSTNNKLSGDQSMQLRWYTSTESNLGYAETNFFLSNVGKVSFKAAATNNLKIGLYYKGQSDSDWTLAETYTPETTANTYHHTFTSELTNVRIKFGIILPSTPPTSTSNVRIDDVVISKEIALSSISVSGQKTDFTQDEDFSFDGTVTATYSDESTSDVTANATFSGYNMSQTGNQTVTVSYTEGSITKTTTYVITVNVNTGKTNQVLFHETFGNNTGSARDWNNSYSVKSGVSSVYSGITGYTVTNAKQGKNTTGSTQSGLNQSTAGTDAVLIIGPLAVGAAENMVLTYQWKAASIKGTYSTSLYYATSADGSYTLVSGTGSGATSFVERTYSLPQAAQVNTLYLKIVWNTSNTQAIIDEVNLQGDY